MACSLERPPKTTATRGLRAVGRVVHRARPYPPTLAAMADRPDPRLPARHASPSRPAGPRTSPTRRSTRRSRWRRRTSPAATWSTAATATRPGPRSRRRSAPSRAGAAWPSPPGWRRWRPCSTWSARRARSSRPRHAYNGTVMQLADLEARGRLTRRAGRRHRHRRRGRGVRRRRAGLAGVADQPGARGRRHRDDHGGGARGRRVRRRRQHLRHPAAPAAARRSASTSSSTRRPSTSPATATSCSARSSPATTSCTPCSRAAATCSAPSPAPLEAWLALRGLRTLHLRVERAQANAAGARPPARRAPGRRRGPLPRLRRHRRDRARPGRDGRRPARPQDDGCGCTPPASAASSRPSSAAAAGRPRPPTIPEGLVRLSVGIEDVEDLWDDLRTALDGRRWR